MELREKAAQLPLLPGVYLYKDQHGEVIYVGKAKNLRARVRSYFNDDRLADTKTGTLIADARDIEYILVDNNKEALALENNLIKQWKPRFNILLRDDKTFPYIKLTNEKYPRVYVTRRLIKDGSTYYGPYFPGNLAHRLVHFIHRHFKVPSCKVDFTRLHTHPCLEFHIHRCLGPCVEDLTTDEAYAAAVRDVRLFLEGRHKDLARDLRARMRQASEETRFEEAAGLRDLMSTVEEMEEKQKIAAAEGENIDILGYHAEPPLVAANLFHLRNGRIVDRREYYLGRPARLRARRILLVAAEADLSQPAVHPQPHPRAGGFRRSRGAGRAAQRETRTQSGDPDAAARAEEGAARSGGDQRETRFPAAFPHHAARHRRPCRKRCRTPWDLPEPPKRIECFDISHIQGTDKVASMVVWEDGRMKKVGLPQIHHPHGSGQRRFRLHARGGDAPLLPPTAGEQGFSEPDAD